MQENQITPKKSRKSTGWFFFDPAIFVHALNSSIKSKFSIIWSLCGLVVTIIMMALPEMTGASNGMILGIEIMCLALVYILVVSVWDIVNMVQLFSSDHTLGVMNLEIRKGRRISAIFFSRYLANKILITVYSVIACLIYLSIIYFGKTTLHSWNALLILTVLPVDIACSCLFLFCFSFWRHRLAIGMSSFLVTLTLMSPFLGMIGQLGLMHAEWTERTVSDKIRKYEANDNYLGQLYEGGINSFASDLMKDYYKFGYAFERTYNPVEDNELLQTSADDQVAKMVMENGIIATSDVAKTIDVPTDENEAVTKTNEVTNEMSPYLSRAFANNVDLSNWYSSSDDKDEKFRYFINDGYTLNYTNLEGTQNASVFDKDNIYTPIYIMDQMNKSDEKPFLLQLNDDYLASQGNKITEKSKQEWNDSILLKTDKVASRKKAALSQLNEVISWINKNYKDKKNVNDFNKIIYEYAQDNLGIFNYHSWINGEEYNMHYNLEDLEYSHPQMLGEQLGDWSISDFANNVQTPPGLAIYNQIIQTLFSFIQGESDPNDKTYGGSDNVGYVDLSLYRSTVLGVPWAMTANEWYHPYTNLSWHYRVQESSRLLFGMEQNFIYQYGDYYFEDDSDFRIQGKDNTYNPNHRFMKLKNEDSTGVVRDTSNKNHPKTAEVYSVPGYNIALIVIGFTFAGFSFLAFFRRVKY